MVDEVGYGDKEMQHDLCVDGFDVNVGQIAILEDGFIYGW